MGYGLNWVQCTVFTTQDVNGKISVKVNSPYRLYVNFITYRFLKVPWQGEQGLEDRRDPCVSKSGTFSCFFFICKNSNKNTHSCEGLAANRAEIWRVYEWASKGWESSISHFRCVTSILASRFIAFFNRIILHCLFYNTSTRNSFHLSILSIHNNL